MGTDDMEERTHHTVTTVSSAGNRTQNILAVRRQCYHYATVPPVIIIIIITTVKARLLVSHYNIQVTHKNDDADSDLTDAAIPSMSTFDYYHSFSRRQTSSPWVKIG